MNSDEDNKRTCKDDYFGSQQYKCLASVSKHIFYSTSFAGRKKCAPVLQNFQQS